MDGTAVPSLDKKDNLNDYCDTSANSGNERDDFNNVKKSVPLQDDGQGNDLGEDSDQLFPGIPPILDVANDASDPKKKGLDDRQESNVGAGSDPTPEDQQPSTSIGDQGEPPQLPALKERDDGQENYPNEGFNFDLDALIAELEKEEDTSDFRKKELEIQFSGTKLKGSQFFAHIDEKRSPDNQFETHTDIKRGQDICLSLSGLSGLEGKWCKIVLNVQCPKSDPVNQGVTVERVEGKPKKHKTKKEVEDEEKDNQEDRNKHVVIIVETDNMSCKPEYILDKQYGQYRVSIEVMLTQSRLDIPIRLRGLGSFGKGPKQMDLVVQVKDVENLRVVAEGIKRIQVVSEIRRDGARKRKASGSNTDYGYGNKKVKSEPVSPGSPLSSPPSPNGITPELLQTELVKLLKNDYKFDSEEAKKVGSILAQRCVSQICV